jgi:nucleoside phosphorylase
LAAGLEQAIAGAKLVISSGLGGALNPALQIGDIVIDQGTTSDAFVAALMASVPEMRSGAVTGSVAAIATPADKAALYVRTTADVVDMESHIAAEVAARHGVPFIALRVVSDTAYDAIPSAALRGMLPGGGVAPFQVLGELARHPDQLPALLKTALNAARAMRVLGSVYRRLDLVRNVGEHLIDMV